MNTLIFATLLAVALAGGSYGSTYDVYTSSNGAPNHVLHYTSTETGEMTLHGRYNTGGAGQTLLVADPLGAANVVTVTPNGRYVLVVNAGSNSITVFARNGGNNEEHLRRINTFDLGVQGLIVNSLAVTDHHVYALAGNPNPLSHSYIVSFRLNHGQLEQLDTFQLPASNDHDFLGTVNEVLGTPTQIDISPGLLTVSAKVADGGNAGALHLVVLDDGLPAHCFTTFLEDPANLAFAFYRLGETVFVTEPVASGLRVVNYDGLTNTAQSAISTTEASACWISRSGNYLYVSNTAANSIGSYTLNADGTSATILEDNAATTTLPGDIFGVDNLVFVLSPAAGTLTSFQRHSDGSLFEHQVASDFLNGASFQNAPVGLYVVPAEETNFAGAYFSGLEFDGEFNGAPSCEDFCPTNMANYAISQLSLNLAAYLEENNFDDAASLFTEGGSYRTLQSRYVGREDIAAALSSGAGLGQGSTTFRVIQSGVTFINTGADRVTSKTSYVVRSSDTDFNAASGSFFDTWVRVDGAWGLDTRFVVRDEEPFPLA